MTWIYRWLYKAGMQHPHFSSPSSLGWSRRRCISALLLAAGLAASGCSSADGGDAVSLETAREALSTGKAVVCDIREPAEQAGGVAAGVRLLPMSQLGTRLAEIPSDPQQPVLLMCNTQNRSRKVVATLRERGYSNVRYVSGGMSGWTAKGWPLVPPSR